MPLTVRKDLIDGHEYVEDDRTGELTRCYRVDGLTSSSHITDDALIAVDSVDPTMHVPKAGEMHETMPDLVVRGVKPTPVRGSRTAIRVYVTYRKIRRRLLDVRLGGIAQQTLTSKDKDGKIMVVGYDSPAKRGGGTVLPDKAFPDPSPDGNDNGYTFSYAQVPFYLPDLTLQIVYLEDSSPIQKWKKYGRKLNKSSWQGGNPREWLCTSIEGIIDSPIPRNLADLPDQQVVTGAAQFFWTVTYNFRYSPLPTVANQVVQGGPGWDPLVLHVDLQTGRTPNDVLPIVGKWPTNTIGNGWKVFQLYDVAEFGDLNLVSAVEQAP